MKKLHGTLRLAFTFTLAAFLGGCMTNKPYTPVQRSVPGDTESASLQVMLDQTIDEFGLPGVQVGILRSGQSPLIASSGTVDREHQKAAINEHSSFRVGSTTKMFVAALMCRLAERNVVSLDDTIDRWFPAYPQASTIRVRDLLHQTSGIKESLFSDPWTLIVSMLNPRKLWNPEGIMRTLGKSAKPAQPGARVFSYANDNYVLLGIIAEKAAGAGLASLLEREFFVPLGMEDTALLPWASRLTNGPVPGYDEYIPLGPHLIASDQTSWDSLAFSAGAMSSSAHDLLIWLDSLFHGRVVSEESLKLMRGWGDARNNGRDESMVEYGLGLSRYDLGGAMLEGHPGGGFGGECFPFYDPVSDTSYVVQYNVSRKDNPAGKAIQKRLLESEARAGR